MKVLVTGASGMLGLQVARIASQELGKGNVVAMTHEDMDITMEPRVHEQLREIKPDVIINCAGIVRSRKLADGDFIRVNASGPHVLEHYANAHGMRLVQISTDCVFDGSGPKSENDKPKPSDIYAVSKALGEVTLEPHLTIRMSFVGLGKRGFLSWLMQQQGEATGYTGAKWNGLTTPWAARKIIKAAQQGLSGLLHVHGEDMTKYQLAKDATEVFGLPVVVVPTNGVVSDMRLRTINAFNDQVPAPPMREQLVELARMWR